MGDNEGEVVVAARCIFLSATAGFKKPVFLKPNPLVCWGFIGLGFLFFYAGFLI